MLHEHEAYANDHQYTYNIKKSKVTHPMSTNRPPLLLNGQPVPVAKIVSLLGMKMRNALVDHWMQLKDRMAQANRDMSGIVRLGALRTPYP
jgi:hypothetical protein